VSKSRSPWSALKGAQPRSR